MKKIAQQIATSRAAWKATKVAHVKGTVEAHDDAATAHRRAETWLMMNELPRAESAVRKPGQFYRPFEIRDEARKHSHQALWHAEKSIALLYMREAKKQQNPLRRTKKNPHDYRATHGGERGSWGKRSMRLPDPREGKLVALGRLTKIEYETDKGEGVAIYFHTFGREYHGAKERGRPKPERQPWLAYTEDGGLVVAGGRYTVKPEGIVG